MLYFIGVMVVVGLVVWFVGPARSAPPGYHK